jgi:tight adherence protein C
MSHLLLATLLTFVTVGVLVLFLLKTFVMPRSIIDVRLDELRRSKSSLPRGPDRRHRKQREFKLAKTVASVSESLPISTQTQSSYKLKLIQAGYRNQGTLSIFFGVKVILSVVLFVLLMAITLSLKYELNIALALGILGFIGGMLLPNVWLNSKLRTRQTEIFHSLPDVLDLMTVCVEAGLGLDSAIIKISEEKQFAKQVLADEFRIVTAR